MLDSEAERSQREHEHELDQETARLIREHGVSMWAREQSTTRARRGDTWQFFNPTSTSSSPAPATCR